MVSGANMRQAARWFAITALVAALGFAALLTVRGSEPTDSTSYVATASVD